MLDVFKIQKNLVSSHCLEINEIMGRHMRSVLLGNVSIFKLKRNGQREFQVWLGQVNIANLTCQAELFWVSLAVFSSLFELVAETCALETILHASCQGGGDFR